MIPGVCPLRPSKFWDVPAPGYENVTPMQFKIMLGMSCVDRPSDASHELPQAPPRRLLAMAHASDKMCQ
jgi:hypothetical protein